jgi:hypothetical protein
MFNGGGGGGDTLSKLQVYTSPLNLKNNRA